MFKYKLNGLRMDQLVNVILAIDKLHSTTEGLDCGPGLGGLCYVYGPLPLFRVTVAYILNSLPEVLLGIILISYSQLLPMFIKGKQTCHTKVSTIYSLNKVGEIIFVIVIPVAQPYIFIFIQSLFV